MRGKFVFSDGLVFLFYCFLFSLPFQSRGAVPFSGVFFPPFCTSTFVFFLLSVFECVESRLVQYEQIVSCRKKRIVLSAPTMFAKFVTLVYVA